MTQQEPPIMTAALGAASTHPPAAPRCVSSTDQAVHPTPAEHGPWKISKKREFGGQELGFLMTRVDKYT